MSQLLRKSQSVELAPNDMTKQGLLDALSKCTKGAVLDGRPFDYTYMSVCISELSNFMSKYDTELAGVLTDLFDCPPSNEEKKRSGAGKLIPFPGLSFIMGTATENLGATISTDMWGSGFMARVIMVYSADEIIPDDMFAKVSANAALGEEISLGLRRIGELKGEMVWDIDARDALRAFRINQKDGAPLHNRLTFYVTRRWLHLAKLCMVAALSEETLTVTLAHFNTALAWLKDAERQMPEIFKDMNSHEDGAVYEELRMHLFQLYMQGGRRPIHASVVYKFLSGRASSNTVQRMIEIAEAAGYLLREAGTSGMDAVYIPSNPAGHRDDGIL